MFDIENEYTPLMESYDFSDDEELFSTQEYLDILDCNDCSEIPF